MSKRLDCSESTTPLEPCPFCRCSGDFENSDSRGEWIVCQNCAARTPAFQYREHLISFWNTRYTRSESAPIWKPVSANDATRGVAWIDEQATHIGKIQDGQRYLMPLPEAPSAAINPAVLPALPGQKALTVTMVKDDGDVQADAAIAAIKAGTSTFQLHNPSPLFFHHLRLRVALEPALAEKIAVYYLTDDRKWQLVGLGQRDAFRWPVGFEQQLWEKEAQISAVRGMDEHPEKCVDTAREMAASLRRKYG